MDADKNPVGRPQSEDPKVHIPGIAIRSSTKDEIKKIADILGKSQSEIYQEALDIWLTNYNIVKVHVVRL